MNAKLIVAIVAVVLSSSLLSYNHGKRVVGAEWKVEWKNRDAKDEAARLAAEKDARELERIRTEANRTLSEKGQNEIDAIKDKFDTANAKSISLQQQSARLLQQLSSSSSSLNSCTSAARATAENTARMFAELFTVADKTAGRMAEIAEQARTRGLTCEGAYDSLQP